MALATGTFGAAAAWALLKLIAIFTNLAYFHTLSTAPYHLARAKLGPLSILVPVAGGVIVGLMARYGSQKIRGHGIPEALDAILSGQSRIEPKVAVLKPLSSAIAIGTGGPFGAEGPIIMTGAALGSLFAQLFQLSDAERKTLLAAGAAAGMTGIFGTPVAAMLLAVEVLLFEWKPRSFVPVAVSAIVARAWRPWLVGAWPLFPDSPIPSAPWWGYGLCAAVGLVSGLQSAFLSSAIYMVEDLFERLPVHWMWWPALGAIIVGFGGWYDPAVLGVGYNNIRQLIGGVSSVHAAASLLIGKAIVWIAALSSGTSGGVLAPLLMMGGALGALESHVLPFGDSGFWALVAMSAVLGGTLRAPLTATVFAVELTGDLRVMPAVVCACIVSFATTVLIMRRSILTERLARRGQHLSYEYSVDPFEVMQVREIMIRSVETLSASLQMPDVIAFFSDVTDRHRHTGYPVIDSEGRVLGMLSRSDLLRWTRGDWRAKHTLGDRLLGQQLLVGYEDELVGRLADRMAAADIGRVPILERKSGKLIGLVTRRDLLQVRARAVRQEQQPRRMVSG
jgi:H+/Cl- antiporter ClcA/CBS domain-containing protein